MVALPSPPLHLARDAWSMVIRLRQATNEYIPPAQKVYKNGVPEAARHAGCQVREGREGGVHVVPF